MIYLFLLHFIADFLMQSREMGQKKSTEFKWLFYHISIQFVIIFIGGILIFPSIYFSFIFSLSNAVIHAIIDWNIWKIYKYSYNARKVDKYYEDKWFYSFVGFDQFLHLSTLAFLYGFL